MYETLGNDVLATVLSVVMVNTVVIPVWKRQTDSDIKEILNLNAKHVGIH